MQKKREGEGMDRVLIMIPSYNEALNIEKVVEEIRDGYPQFDYLVINDGSTDQTARICREKGYHLLDLPMNLGLDGCFQAGMKYAFHRGYAAAVQFDGDGQHRPEYLAGMYEKIASGFDIVIGSRFVESPKELSVRMLGSRLIAVAIWMTTGVRIFDPTSGLRMFNRRMIKEFALNLNYGPEPDTISFLLKQGAKITEVPVIIHARVAGESYLRPTVAVRYMVRMMMSILLVQNFRV